MTKLGWGGAITDLPSPWDQKEEYFTRANWTNAGHKECWTKCQRPRRLKGAKTVARKLNVCQTAGNRRTALERVQCPANGESVRQKRMRNRTFPRRNKSIIEEHAETFRGSKQVERGKGGLDHPSGARSNQQTDVQKNWSKAKKGETPLGAHRPSSEERPRHTGLFGKP